MSRPQPPAGMSSNRSVSIQQSSALCRWYLRSVNLGTYREQLALDTRPFNFPPDITEEKIVRTLALVKGYREYSRIKGEGGAAGSTSPSRQETRASLSQVPLVVIFYVALGLACEWTTMDVKGSRPPQQISWKKYGFPDPQEGSTHHCFCHGPGGCETPADLRPAYPCTDVLCSPDICTAEMQSLYSKLKFAISEACWVEAFKTSPESLRKALSQADHVSTICTGFLRNCDFGNRVHLLEDPWARVQVVMGNVYPPRVYYMALLLLANYRTSSGFDAGKLCDIPLEWVFYATFLISSSLTYDWPHPPRAVLFSLGFPEPTERQTGRRICFDHSLGQEQRILEEELYVMCGDRKSSEERRREEEARRKAETEASGGEVGVRKGPIHGVVSPLDYMGCEGVFPCVEGMVRLKDYLLVHVFQWNLSTSADEQFFAKFERDLERTFIRR